MNWNRIRPDIFFKSNYRSRYKCGSDRHSGNRSDNDEAEIPVGIFSILVAGLNRDLTGINSFHYTQVCCSSSRAYVMPAAKSTTRC
ncbi:hypothetical protein, partial [Burkholderia ubonensis]|uniref:hypothetical protein n=1 Tax=Burkholderia ubonensis TaxID=101571 RepID=UPI001E46C7BA